MFKKVLFIIFGLRIILFSGVVFSQTPLTTAPNFSAIDSRGNYHDLYSYLNNGKYVLLDFFYNECLVCQTHVPEVNNAYIQFGCNTHEVYFLGVNYDNTDGEVISFENEYGLHYSNISGIDGGGNDIVSLFQVIAFPTIILIAPDKSIPKPDIWPLTVVNITDELLSSGVDTISCPYASINESAISDNIVIYPNPAREYLYVASEKQQGFYDITITDFLGKEVFSKEEVHLTKERINTSNFNTGIYFIHISRNSAPVLSQKVIIY